MKRFLVFLFLISICFTSTYGDDAFYVPPYYSQSNFLISNPSVSGDAAGAMFNPAVLGLSDGAEVLFFWNDLMATEGTLKNWSLLTKAGGLGFNLQQWDYPDTTRGTPHRSQLYDYNIAMGFGEPDNVFGIGYSWSQGDMSHTIPRDDVLSMGYIGRPNRYLSYGVAGHYALNERDIRGILDFGFRPFGTRHLTIFGDMALQDNQTLEDMPWSAGIEVEPFKGITLFGKYFENETFTAGLTFTINTSSTKFMQRYDKDANLAYSTYGIRVGTPQPDVFMPMVIKDRLLLQMDFTDNIRYQRYVLFDEGGHTLMELLTTLDKVKKDPKIGGLVLKITETMSGSWEVIWEVRQKILEVKKAGKKVYVFFERGGMPQYYLASAGDKIMTDPETTVPMFGFNLGRTYYKNTLEKIGVGFHALQYFDYKTAVEGFSREDMSEGDREQLKAIIDDWYDIYRGDVCAARDISEEDFDHVINQIVLMDADSLLHYNLVDTTGRWDDFTEWVGNELENTEIINKQIFTMMQPEYDEWGVQPRIAVIYALGPCAMNYGINANRLKGVIQGARNNKHVKAVVFRADSPGGDILPSDIVAEELKKTAEEKPVIVSQGMVAGSGGYWISMYGDEIMASPWTITGSIGVIGGWIYDDGFGDKIGFTYDNVQRGDHADAIHGMSIPLMGSIPDRPLSEWELGMMEKMIKTHYQNFLEKVGKGRDMTTEDVHEVAQGRIWSGLDGKENNLVDKLGGLSEAIELAREKAKMHPDRHYEIHEMPGKGLMNPGLFQPKLLGIRWYDSYLDQDNPNIQYMRMMLESGGKPLIMMPPAFYLE